VCAAKIANPARQSRSASEERVIGFSGTAAGCPAGSGDLAALGAALNELAGDLGADIARPTLGVLKATMRTGFTYWLSSRPRMIDARSVPSLVSR